jgi:hypothetical protein
MRRLDDAVAIPALHAVADVYEAIARRPDQPTK